MEVDPQRMWNFDRFFQEVTAIVKLTVIINISDYYIDFFLPSTRPCGNRFISSM